MTKNLLEDRPAWPEQYKAQNPALETMPKNLILYGPPGTGKTYQSIHYALAILENQPLEAIEQESRTLVMKRFRHYQTQGQIAWLTFHPSYTYEDFVQGLKPNTQAGTLLFERKDGVFKQIADRARKNYDSFSKQQNQPKIPFSDLLDSLLSHRINPETEEIEIPLDINHRIYKSVIIYDLSEEALIYRRRTKNDIVKDEGRKLLLSKLARLYEGQEIKEAINEKYYQAIVEAVREHEASLHAEEERKELKNFVLVIDEINRANISQVFGELITLIEEDKRYGMPNGLTATLPSGEELAVPSNLYLLGTMNTADKSIALLDIALRRRFQFRSIFPQIELVTDQALRNILQSLNQALYEEKNSSDFLIGHAYFLQKSVADLPTLINEQIIPLLEEYFTHQPHKIPHLLKAAGITIEQKNYQWRFKTYQP